jgi:hypothetical protein
MCRDRCSVSVPRTTGGRAGEGAGGGSTRRERFGGVFGIPDVGRELVQFGSGRVADLRQDAREVTLRIDVGKKLDVGKTSVVWD